MTGVFGKIEQKGLTNSKKFSKFGAELADVAELVDALDSGSSNRKVVKVQVLSSAFENRVAMLLCFFVGLVSFRASRGIHKSMSTQICLFWRPEGSIGSSECPCKYQPLITDYHTGSEALPPRGVGYELKVSVANDLTPQSDEVATSMDPSCPSDSSVCGSVMGLQAIPRLSPWGVIGRFSLQGDNCSLWLMIKALSF